ncbi:hypothetical protein RFI_26493 [Reticulomyxa filosa]|uniref:Uncharacterized protein n=1 Tax=Reticulomyxa filosa TaxID=46433 RepID=X6MBT2_RETFI|nr:hypothetical protein RFI_26493 [Reticulomyxa filosa]|eukprot:ETO10882.1 hypothetical protein RFI_26493 [Reticulomyxa filosa]
MKMLFKCQNKLQDISSIMFFLLQITKTKMSDAVIIKKSSLGQTKMKKETYKIKIIKLKDSKNQFFY